MPCMLSCPLSAPTLSYLMNATSFPWYIHYPLVYLALFSLCSTFILITWPYHLNRFSVICALLLLSLVFISDLIPPCHSANPSQHPHLSYFCVKVHYINVPVYTDVFIYSGKTCVVKSSSQKSLNRELKIVLID